MLLNLVFPESEEMYYYQHYPFLYCVSFSKWPFVESWNGLSWKRLLSLPVQPSFCEQENLQLHPDEDPNGFKCFREGSIYHFSMWPVYLHPYKKFLPYIYSLNLPSFSLKSLPLVLLQQSLLRICPPLSFRSPLIIVRSWWGVSRVSWSSGLTAPALSACSHRSGVPSLW